MVVCLEIIVNLIPKNRSAGKNKLVSRCFVNENSFENRW
jgi:hypothetical protein